MLPVGKFKAALRSQAASLSSKFMKFALFTSHETFSLPAPFSTKFDDAPTDVVSPLLCNWLKHATTLYEESKKLTYQFFVVAMVIRYNHGRALL